MILSGVTAPNLPDGENYDSEHDIFIMMQDGQGLGVVQKDGSVMPFPYSFHVITGEPTGESVNAKRYGDTKPKMDWSKSVIESSPATPAPQNWAGYDPALEGSDKTAIGIFSSLPGGSIRLDGIISELGGLMDDSNDGVMPQFPDPADFVEIPAPQPVGSAREFLARMFEPESHNARLKFRPGDIVALKRADLFGWIPVGAEGEIMALEHPESVMASKGRHYSVKFDLKPFNVPIDRGMLEIIKQKTDPPYPEFHEFVTTNAGANDLELVKAGFNWNDDYQQPYEVDAIAEAMPNMTPEDWQRELTAITSHILNGHINPARSEEIARRETLQAHEQASAASDEPPFGFLNPSRLGVPPEVLDSTMQRYREQRHKDEQTRTPGVPPDKAE